jgi:hypothetical protein
MSFHHSPRIVTNGLVLCLDAGNRKSYLGTGSTWRDLSQNNNNVTLINSPTFSTSNFGNFSFNGSTQGGTIPNNTLLNTQTPSVEVWFRTSNLNQFGFFFEKGSVNTQYSLFMEGTNGIRWRQNFGAGYTSLDIPTTNLITNTWYQLVGTFISGTRRLYLNGVLITSDSQAGTISTNNSGMTIGAYNGGGPNLDAYYYNGSMSIIRVYNRNLSPSEVLQNYNATKGRFNL